MFDYRNTRCGTLKRESSNVVIFKMDPPFRYRGCLERVRRRPVESRATAPGNVMSHR